MLSMHLNGGGNCNNVFLKSKTCSKLANMSRLTSFNDFEKEIYLRGYSESGSFRPWVVSPGRFALGRFALVLWVGRFALIM